MFIIWHLCPSCDTSCDVPFDVHVCLWYTWFPICDIYGISYIIWSMICYSFLYMVSVCVSYDIHSFCMCVYTCVSCDISHISLLKILILITSIYFLLLYFFNFYSLTIFCIFSPSLHPTPGSPTSLPHFYPPPWFCPGVLYSSSYRPLSSLSRDIDIKNNVKRES